MNVNFILAELSKHDNIIIDFRTIENMSDFKEQSYIRNMESLVLQISGHKPLTESIFSKNKLDVWCESNNIYCYYDIVKREYHLIKRR
jgi:hypothetical protein